VAGLFSHHIDPEARLDPRYQQTSPMNAKGTAPMMTVRSTPYGDGAVPVRITGMVPSPMAQQRIVLGRPNLAGLPELQLTPAMADELAAQRNPGALAMSGTEQVEMMGIDTSVGGQQRRRRTRRVSS
jgi:hypothetical protein